jgi:CheY-like chemotaxis protein
MAKEILIGDSDKANQREFQKILGTTDYHLVFSDSGEDVLLRVKLFKPDLIIAGTALSDKNGYQLCEAIKDDPDFGSIPFILLLNRSERIPDKDRERLKPDGILSRPLHESEVRNLVDRLLEGMRSNGGGAPRKKMELETFADMGEERFASSQPGGQEEEEVIDLMDIVEEVADEPESKMSIDDFVVPEKAEPLGEITWLESWEKLGEEEKVAAEEGIVLSVEGRQEETKDFPYELKKEVPPPKEPQEEDLFEKIELEDVLEKVGKIGLPPEREEPAEMEVKALNGEPAPVQEVEEKPFAFDEFEMAFKKGVEVEVPRQKPPKEEALQPFSLEEIREKATEEKIPSEISIEEKVEAIDEEFPKDLLEDMLKEEQLKEEGLEEGKLEEEELREEGLKEEELKEEELKGEGLLEEELRADKLFEEEELLEEGGPLEEELLEEGKPLEEETLELVRELQEEEKIDLFEGLEAPEVPKVRKRAIREAPEVIAKRAEAIEVDRFFETGTTPPLRKVDQQMEEVISEKVQVMMEEFVRRHVPEMTKDMVQLALKRIEKMVREIVPDLAEKMIEEEIRRLEKGEKG